MSRVGYSISFVSSSSALPEKEHPQPRFWLNKLFLGVLILLPVVLGVLTVLSAALAGQLTHIAGNGFWSATISDTVATIIVSALIFHGPPIKDGIELSVKAVKEEPKVGICWFGGVLGAYYIGISVFLPPEIGYGLLYVCVVCGQVVLSLLFDRFGWTWVQKTPVTRLSYTGAGMVVVGTILFQLQAILSATFTAYTFLYIILGIVGGVCLVVQTSFNRKIASTLGTPYRGSWVSFVVGTVVLLICSLIAMPHPRFYNTKRNDWWKYLGGFCGSFFVTATVILPTYIGYAAMYAWTIFGQLCASLIFDSVGLFGSKKQPVSGYRIAGMVIVLAGVVVVQLAKVRAAKKAAEAERKNPVVFKDLEMAASPVAVPEETEDAKHSQGESSTFDNDESNVSSPTLAPVQAVTEGFAEKTSEVVTAAV